MSFSSLSSWHSRAALVRLGRRFLAIFGGCWLLTEPLAWWKPNYLQWGVKGYLVLLAISALFALGWAWPKKIVSQKLPVPDTKITVGVGDLFEQEGNVIVGCSDVFETELGDDFISKRSVQGQFQLKVFPDTEELDSAIARSLTGVPFKIDHAKPKGKNARYEIGTVALVKARGNRYFLLAYTIMQNDTKVESDISKLSLALNRCWERIRTKGQNEPVHMAIIGSEFARVGLSRGLLLQFIILSFLAAQRRERLTSELNIHVYGKDADDIDFVNLDGWLEGLKSIA
jgi:antiphage defense system Thoeris ThsA-like protein